MTESQIQYFVLACKALEVESIETTTLGVGRGFGGMSPEGEAKLRKMRRTLYDYLELVVHEESKNG